MALPNVINFFLEEDSATRGHWNTNNTGLPIAGAQDVSFKPVRYGLTGYAYDRNEPAGQRLFIMFFWALGRYLIDPHEAMSYACRSQTQTVNAEGSRTYGSVDVRIDMAALSFGSEHSAQWARNFFETKEFYYLLLEEFGISYVQ